MKHSIYTVGLISLAISIFSSSAQADGVTKVQLSTTPIIIANKHVHHVLPRKVSSSRTHHKRWVKSSYRKRIVHPRQVRKNNARTNNLRKKARVKARTRVTRVRNTRSNPLIRYHHIKRGDSLYKIAKKYKVTVKHILQINNLKSTVVKVGGRLRVYP